MRDAWLTETAPRSAVHLTDARVSQHPARRFPVCANFLKRDWTLSLARSVHPPLARSRAVNEANTRNLTVEAKFVIEFSKRRK